MFLCLYSLNIIEIYIEAREVSLAFFVGDSFGINVVEPNKAHNLCDTAPHWYLLAIYKGLIPF